MSVQVRISKEMQAGFPQSVRTSLTNLADLITVEMKHIAPFANPAQYPNGYPGVPGTLESSLARRGEGKDAEIIAGVRYAIRRNYENNLNPQTLFYIQRACENAQRGEASRWWRVDSGAALGRLKK